ncbi:hypothetical protein NHX12_032566 [Muraenolepis orangiensis]|uniref:Coiled-coil domain-containing protein 43 n=1 Tax=Muraenolepis orangiensis TaxID=630683 RepID=A0A9Q0E832_9TELE|nr:hypothetical protein NHX12_032566 [Muraenolepis orangiensis]
MAAPVAEHTGEFEAWLNERLEALDVDREVYGGYLMGVLQEGDCEEETLETIQGIMAAFLEGDALEDVCEQIVNQWTDHCNRSAKRQDNDADVQAIASLMEKQAQIVVKQKEASGDSKIHKESVLAQYANITDEEDEGEEDEAAGASYIPSGEKSLFKNTNVEQVLNRQKEKRDQAREDSRKKKETDKMQREKDKLDKVDRKDKEKKRTQKGERKR